MKIITTHDHYDFDALASIVSVKKLYKDAIVILPYEAESNVKKFLKIYPNILESSSIQDIDLNSIDEIIIVDTSSKRRISSFISCLDNKKIKITIFDHHIHNENDIVADNSFIKHAGSTVSIILNEIFKNKKIEFSKDEILLFLLGIYEDTGKLTYPTTTNLDKRICSILLGVYKGNEKDLNVFLETKLDDSQMNILNIIKQNQKVYSLGKFSVVFSGVDISENIWDLSSIVHKYKEENNFTVIFCVFKKKEKIHVIARSQNKNFPVLSTIKYFNGGGHETAASALLLDKTLDEVLYEVKKIFFQYVVYRKKIFDFDLFKAEFLREFNFESWSENLKAFVYKYKGVLYGIYREELEKLAKHKILFNKKCLFYPVVKIQDSKKIISLKEYIHNTPLVLFIESSNGANKVLSQKEIVEFFPYEVSLDKGYKKYISKKYLGKKIMNILEAIKAMSSKNGMHPYLVGGVVRDIFMKSEIKDVDIVIDKGSGIEFAKNLAQNLNLSFESFDKFNTAKIGLKQNMDIDIATTRSEYYPYPASLPVVSNSILWDDMQRRDFTVNAMAICLAKENYGYMADFFGGLKDLENKIIRVMHNLSFIDDPTRIYRAVRFIARFGFKFDEHTERLFVWAVESELHKKISSYRLTEEIKLLLGEASNVNIIKIMDKYNIFSHIHKNIIIDYKLIENIMDSLFVSMLYVHNQYKEWFVFLLGVCDNLKEDQIKELSINLTKEEKQNLLELKSKINLILSKISKEKTKPSEVFYLINSLSIESVIYILAKSKTHLAKKRIFEYLTKTKHIRLHIDGNKLKSMGIKEGSLYRKILQTIYEAKLDGKLHTLEQELEYAMQLIKKF
jgi:tRNA nucleotidyltransferase (CCA-adding enzyme)